MHIQKDLNIVLYTNVDDIPNLLQVSWIVLPLNAFKTLPGYIESDHIKTPILEILGILLVERV